MEKFMTKKNILLIALGGTVLFFLCVFSQTFALCAEYQWSCTKKFDSVAEILQIFIPLFLLSLITYKLRNEVFRAWLMFATWWVPLTILLVTLAPSNGHSLVPIDTSRVSLFMNALFLIFSLAIIAWKYFSLRKKE